MNGMCNVLSDSHVCLCCLNPNRGRVRLADGGNEFDERRDDQPGVAWEQIGHAFQKLKYVCTRVRMMTF